MGDYRAYATACLEALQRWYNWHSGLWATTGWWNAANAIYAIADYSSLMQTDRYLPVIVNTFAKNRRENFLNRYYDDEGWWGLAWLRVYDLTGEDHYLQMAERLFADMCGGWDDVCGGGIWWRKDRDYKNAIPNELFLSLAAHLYRRTRIDDYLTRATVAWRWFLDSGMQNEQYLINDGLRNCQNNGGITWTYNQGVILGALAEMFLCTAERATSAQGEIQYLIDASNIASAVLATLVDANGILLEPLPPGSKDENPPQFKGIFMQNLASFYHVAANITGLPFACEPYRQFIMRNADALWQHARTPHHTFGFHWSRRPDREDATRQISALMAFNAALPFSS
ncbi:MAG TPA: glycoside hydrolase family 76 protein [Ktedonobacteraceae bacterium]|nr:glycoside hydrolase family 76 protein [Ktedonobacteraceae bacterium]